MRLLVNETLCLSLMHTHLAHKPLFLLHANVQQLGLIQNFIKSQMMSITSLVSRLRKKERERQRCKKSLNVSQLHLHLWLTAWQPLITVMLESTSFHCGNCQAWHTHKKRLLTIIWNNYKITLTMCISHISVKFHTMFIHVRWRNC